MFSIHYRRKNHGSANMSWMYVVLQKSRICILLISWMKSGRSFVIWRAPVWISSLLGALNGWPPWSFYMPLLKDRVEELGPQNESVRSFPRGKAELLYAVFVKSSWLLWRRTKKTTRTQADSLATFYTWKPSKSQGIHGLDFEHQCHHRCEDFSCATLFDGSALLDCCQWKHRHHGWKSSAFKGWHQTPNEV